MKRPPDFIIIGAMKSATTTLHEQLGAQSSIFMANPKETSFFSNDEIYAKGINWYFGQFDDAGPSVLCGESSTHYTKLPTYPLTVERMAAHLRNVKLIYIMRHPIDRLLSQYVHEWSERNIEVPLDKAVDLHEELVAYSRYAMQLKPFIRTFGFERILPVFFERLTDEPQSELERICRFIGYHDSPQWRENLGKTNVSAERIRKSWLRDLIIRNPLLTAVRRALVPKVLRNFLKTQLRMGQRSELSTTTREQLISIFDTDLRDLGCWLGININCENWYEQARRQPHTWLPNATLGDGSR